MRWLCLTQLTLLSSQWSFVVGLASAKPPGRLRPHRQTEPEPVNPDGAAESASRSSGLERLKASVSSGSEVRDEDDESRFYNVSEWNQAISGGRQRQLLNSRSATTLAVGAQAKAQAIAPNLCMDGKLVPSLYLLGAQKCATSSFAAELLQSPNLVGPHHPSWTTEQSSTWMGKELHYFDNTYRYSAKGRSFWLAHWPQCPAASQHFVAADFTPSYLSAWEAPSRLKETYGGHANRLTFLVILREPLARMQSSFYHGKSDGWVAPQFATFEEYVQHSLQKYRSGNYRHFHNGSSDMRNDAVPFTLSLYYEHLAHWLWYFHPAQFVIAPMKSYVTAQNGLFQGEPDLIRTTAARPGIEAFMPPTEFKEPTPHINVHSHPLVERDLHPATMAAIRQVFDTTTGPVKLATLLVPAMKKGLQLYGYHGPPQDASFVARYISAMW